MGGVTAIQELCKQPAEKRRFSMEFASLLVKNETISTIDSITSETIDGNVSDLIISVPSIVDGQSILSKIECWIEAGTSGLKYRVEILLTTSDGQILEGDGILNVTDR